MPAKFFTINPSLQAQLETILEATWNTFPTLAQNQIAVTWIAYEPPYRVNTGGALSAEEFWKYRPQGASYRGVELIDPAGMVMLFYMVAMHAWLQQDMVSAHPEINRALVNVMAGDSCEASNYLVDVLSGTTSGPSLPPGPFETWKSQRNIINRYFQRLSWPELRSINVNQKLWQDGPYGREHDFVGQALENRNLLTTEATARLFHSIVGGVAVNSSRSQEMMRSLAQSGSYQVQQLAQQSINRWTKASFSPLVAHQAVYTESEVTHPYIVVVFTEHASEDRVATHTALTFVLEQIGLAAKQNFQAIE